MAQLPQSTIAQFLIGYVCEEFVFDSLRCCWCRWDYDVAKWRPIAKIEVLQEIQNHLDGLLPLGYSAATLTAVERLLRLYLGKRIPVDQSTANGFTTEGAYKRWQAHQAIEGAEK